MSTNAGRKEESQRSTRRDSNEEKEIDGTHSDPSVGRPRCAKKEREKRRQIRGKKWREERGESN